MFIQSQRVFLPLPMGEPAPAVQPCSLVYGERGKIWMCPRVYSWKVYMFGNLYSWKVYMLTCLEACRTSSEDKIIYINKPHHPKFRFFDQVFFWRILVENHCPQALWRASNISVPAPSEAWKGQATQIDTWDCCHTSQTILQSRFQK